MKLRFILLFLLIPVTSYSIDNFQIPQPPKEKKDEQPKNQFLDKLNLTCTKEGYSWEWREGPDFDLYYFNNKKLNHTGAGFYLGNHPAFIKKNNSGATRVKLGMLNKNSVEWQTRPSRGGDGYALETLIPLRKYKYSGLILYLNFWFNIQNEAEGREWLNWVKCFEIKQDPNVYEEVDSKIKLKYKGTVEKSRLLEDKPYEKYYYFEITK